MPPKIFVGDIRCLAMSRMNAYTLYKGDDTHSNKLRQYYGTTFLRHNIARLS